MLKNPFKFGDKKPYNPSSAYSIDLSKMWGDKDVFVGIISTNGCKPVVFIRLSLSQGRSSFNAFNACESKGLCRYGW
ncbi:hypothetical protein CFOL_v3_00353 [Cephalotus follicularis]|uniref:Uncharacterized protein n=1 Tax=Cephalotus follicularis TaxID=3775 RepID=A0A1Q3AM37_CEPFO|nr:hypothetical protein CFOL_v3_00353 [Cephalotus follicularis]